MFCIHCGVRLKDHSKFCTGCGAPVMASSPPSSPPAAPPDPVPSDPVRASSGGVGVAEPPLRPTQGAAAPLPPFPPLPPFEPIKPKRSFFMPLVVGGSALVVAALVFCTLFFRWYEVLPWFGAEELTPDVSPSHRAEVTPKPDPTQAPESTPEPRPSPTPFTANVDLSDPFWDSIIAVNAAATATSAAVGDYIYFQNYNNEDSYDSILRLDTTTNETGTFLRFDDESMRPLSIAALGGDLYIAVSCYFSDFDTTAYFRIPAAGGDLEPLFVLDQPYMLYSHNNTLYLAADYSTGLYNYDPETNALTFVPIITEEDKDLFYFHSNLGFHENLFYCIVDTAEGQAVYACDPVTGEKEPLYTFPDGYINNFYSIDGAYWLDVYYMDSYESKLLRYDIATGETRVVVEDGDHYYGLVMVAGDGMYYMIIDEQYNAYIHKVSLTPPYENQRLYDVRSDYYSHSFQNLMFNINQTLYFPDGQTETIRRTPLGLADASGAADDVQAMLQTSRNGAFNFARFDPAYSYACEDEAYVYLLKNTEGDNAAGGNLYRLDKRDLAGGRMLPELLCDMNGNDNSIAAFALAPDGTLVFRSSFELGSQSAYYAIDPRTGGDATLLGVGGDLYMQRYGDYLYILERDSMTLFSYRGYGEALHYISNLSDGDAVISPHFSLYNNQLYYILETHGQRVLHRLSLGTGVREIVGRVGGGYAYYDDAKGLVAEDSLRIGDALWLDKTEQGYVLTGGDRTHPLGDIQGSVQGFTKDWIFTSMGLYRTDGAFAGAASYLQSTVLSDIYSAWNEARMGLESDNPPGVWNLFTAAPEGFMYDHLLFNPDNPAGIVEKLFAYHENGEVVIDIRWAALPEGSHAYSYHCHGTEYLFEPDEGILQTLYHTGNYTPLEEDNFDTIRIPYDGAFMANDFYFSIGVFTEEGIGGSFVLNLFHY